MCVCLCVCDGGTTAERPGGSGPEEPRDADAAGSGLRGAGGGAAGRASLRRVRPQERRLPSRILTATSGSASAAAAAAAALSLDMSPQRHADGATMRRCLHRRLQQRLKLRRRSHRSSFSETNFTQTWKMTPVQKPLFTQTQLFGITYCFGITFEF